MAQGGVMQLEWGLECEHACGLRGAPAPGRRNGRNLCPLLCEQAVVVAGKVRGQLALAAPQGRHQLGLLFWVAATEIDHQIIEPAGQEPAAMGQEGQGLPGKEAHATWLVCKGFGAGVLQAYIAARRC